MKKFLRVAFVVALCLLTAAAALAEGGIVGAWSGEGTAMGAVAITAQAEFKQDLTFGLEVTVMGSSKKMAGQYLLKDELLTLSVPGMEPVGVACQIAGDTMKLSGKLDFGAFKDVQFSVAMTRKTQPAAASVTIKVPEGEKALVKVGDDLYEAVKGAQLPVLSAQVEGVEKPKLSWKSTKAKFLSVNAKGVIKAKKAGTATLTATVKVDKKTSIKDEITVRVVTCALKQKKATLYVGGATKKKPATVELMPVILPADASEAAKTVTWVSSDAAVAAVDEKGVVTAVAKGKASITMTNQYGQTAVCKVTVK